MLIQGGEGENLRLERNLRLRDWWSAFPGDHRPSSDRPSIAHQRQMELRTIIMTDRRTNALAHLEEALDALTTEGYIYNPATGEEARIDPIACTIAVDLERVDAAIGPRGQSMFATLAEEIKRAVIEIVAAKQALESL